MAKPACKYLLVIPTYNRTGRYPSGARQVCATSFRGALKAAQRHARSIHDLDRVLVLNLTRNGSYERVAEVGHGGWKRLR